MIEVLIGERPVSTGNSLGIEAVSLHAARMKEPNPRTIASRGPTLTKRPIVYRRIDPLIPACRGTLAGDLLWLGTIGFILSDHHGVGWLSGPVHCSRASPFLWLDKANPRPCTRGSEAIPFGTTACAV
jgi:hypothetical protein